MRAAPVFLERLLRLTETIQQIPAPTFFESQRSLFMLEQFQMLGLAQVSQDQAGNVLGCLPGGNRPPLVVSAHLDTVFPAGTDLHLHYPNGKIAAPGIGDNALGLAGLIGLVCLLQENQASLAGDLWLAADTGEEGLGNLRGMHALVDRFGDSPLGYLVLEGMGLGSIFHRGSAVARYRVSLNTPGGHPWTSTGSPSAVHEIARLITHLADLPLPSTCHSTLNVGLVSGGTTINTIASHAELELDLRSEKVQVLEELSSQVKEVAAQAASPDIKMDITEIGSRPAGSIPANHRLVRLAQQCLREQDVDPQLMCSSTDANLPLSLGLPALCLGVTCGGDAHTLVEYIEIEPVMAGMAQLLGFVRRAWPE